MWRPGRNPERKPGNDPTVGWRFLRRRSRDTAPITEEPMTAEAQADEGVAVAEQITEPILAPSQADDEHAGTAPTSLLSGLGDISIAVPAPGALDAPTVRQWLLEGWRLASLSTRARRVPRPVLPVLVSAWAASVGLLCAALIAWVATGSQQGFGAAAWLWLAGHHAPLATDVGAVTLLPMGLLLSTVLPLRRAGRFVAIQVPRAHVVGVGGIAICCYVVWAAVVATMHRELPSVPVGWAVWWTGLAAVTAGAWGARRQLRGGLRLPPVVVSVMIAVGVPLAVGLVAVLALVGTNCGTIVGAQQDAAGSGLDQVGLTLLQLGYLPNLVVWGGAFAVGTGFSVGADGVVSPYSGAQPVLPDLPVLAAVPGSAPNWTALLPIAVAVAGAVAAVVFARHSPEPHLGRRIARVLMLAVGAGLTWFVLGVLAGGGIGTGRLAALGPAAGTSALAALLVAAGGMVWALLPTLATDARPVAVDLRTRIGTKTKAESVAGR